ncbi:MAG: SUMF1/EgtB/PvdO family nonheme iron enzyme [Terriglobia bacterium]
MGSDAGLRQQLSQARVQTDALFGLLSPDALYQRPIADRHRLIFYLGHFEAFDWNLLALRGMSAASFNADFDRLFERGIDPPAGQAPSDSSSDWPGRDEVDRYRTATRQWIDAHLNDMDAMLVQMAIEHRHMHAETFAYLMHNLPYRDKLPQNAIQAESSSPVSNPMVRIAAGETTLGKSTETFGWDNEHLAHSVFVPAFGISKYKVSNGEYLEFVHEGGPAPNFWSREGGQWFYRGMFGMAPLPLDHPVWVTWQQAEAYAGYRGMRLPSEAQFQRAASGLVPDARRDNFDFRRWDPIPVHASNGTGDRPSQMIGNGWEWTRDVFAPFGGFAAHPFYPGYSADFFDGGHYVMKGASPRTAALLTRPSFRNWFRPDYPYMYAGFRLVED